MVPAKLRTYLSIGHLRAADEFAWEAGEMEDEYCGGDYDEGVLSRHLGYVMASIMMSCAFVDGFVNELLQDCVEKTGEEVEQLPDDVVIRLAMWWENNASDHPGLEKRIKAISDRTGDWLAEGREPYQGFYVLKRLRNRLVHYEPQWFDAGVADLGGDRSSHKLSRQLRTQEFGLNPLVGEGTPFFPKRCLSHGCAVWAVESVVGFGDEFWKGVGTKPPYDHVRDDLHYG